jgi:uncharacterized protein YndB with AHSA1/START domain
MTLAASPEAVWRAIIDPALVAEYHLAPLRVLELRPGGVISYGTKREEMILGKVVEFEVHRRLVHTFRFGPSQPGTAKDPETTVSYLTLTHSGFPSENQTYANISNGWPYILDAMEAILD